MAISTVALASYCKIELFPTQWSNIFRQQPVMLLIKMDSMNLKLINWERHEQPTYATRIKEANRVSTP